MHVQSWLRRVVALTAATAGALAMTVLPAASARAAGEERVESVETAYRLRADGSADVTETWVWDFGSTPRHGIQRMLVTAQAVSGKPDTQRLYALSDVDAESPSGAPAMTDVSDDGSGLTTIRVGDPAVTVDGEQTYVLRYHLDHVVNGFADHVELYWNVTGDQVALPVGKVTVTVQGPAGAAVTRARCLWGATGASKACAAKPGAVARFSAGPLAPHEQVTVVAAVPLAAFSDVAPETSTAPPMGDGSGDPGAPGEPGLPGDPGAFGGPYRDYLPEGAVPSETTRRAVAWSFGLGSLVVPLGAAGAVVFARRRRRDLQFAGVTPGLMPGAGATPAVVPADDVVVAVQFQPPQGVTAGLVGTLIDGEANPVDVSATVVDLAVRGHLRIAPVTGRGRDWELTRAEPGPADSLLPHEDRLLAAIFRSGPVVRVSALRYHFRPSLRAAQDGMYEEVVRRGWYASSPRPRWSTAGAVGVGLLPFGLLLTIVLGAVGATYGTPLGAVLGVGVLITGAVLAATGRTRTPRTATGTAVRVQALGFRQYLLTAEANQIAFEEALDVFTRYLPYAIVFGVADRWARLFADVAQAAASAGYDVTAMRSAQTLVWLGAAGSPSSIADLGRDLQVFSSTASAAFVDVAPATAGSSGLSGFGSGGSGFSGGSSSGGPDAGSSGGGGGGGGASSW